MVVEAVEDLDAAAVGEVPVGAVGLPELVGQRASKRMNDDSGRLWGCGAASILVVMRRVGNI